MPNEKKYIEAENIVEFIDNNSISVNDGYEKTYTLADIRTYIDDIPTADVAEVRHGRWYNTENGYFCTICDGASYAEYEYCPNCGSKMDVKSE